tara:strand:- start:115 stop:276 length:162 start_codon:yes stop_codon:yes gene_type:complete
VHTLAVAVVEEPLLLVLVAVVDLQVVENFLVAVEMVMEQKLIQLQAHQDQVLH